METSTAGPRPRPRRASTEVRERLVEAAIAEFAARGFAGASTRAIAARAGAHQPQINYHFASKEALWKAALERLLVELDEMLVVEPSAAPRDAMAEVVRGLVRFAARRPELNRIMMHEGTDPSDRLRWLTETHTAPRARALRTLWDEAASRGEAAPVPGDLVFHVLVGAASLLHANAPEARLLFGIEPSAPDVVEAHADALVRTFLPERGD